MIMTFSIWNAVTTPIEIAFTPKEFTDGSGISTLNTLIDGLFCVDIVLNMRTSFMNPLTGDEITDPKLIAINYIKGPFWIDLISALPIDKILKIDDNHKDSKSSLLKILKTLKLFRLFRLSKLINYMNSTEDIKQSLKLFKLCLYLVIWMNL